MARQTDTADISLRALEMIMRDVLEGIEELSLQAGCLAGLDRGEFRLLSDQLPAKDNLIYFTPAQRRVA